MTPSQLEDAGNDRMIPSWHSSGLLRAADDHPSNNPLSPCTHVYRHVCIYIYMYIYIYRLIYLLID